MEVTNDHLLSLHAREACTLLGYIHDLTPMDGRCACGLRNIGNTCYANAILACFSQVVALRKWTAQHKALCREEHAHPTSCVLCSLAEDLQQLSETAGNRPIIPKVVRARAEWYAAFNGHEQQDAEEAFAVLLDKCNAVDERAVRALLPLDACKDVLPTTPMWSYFGGLLRTRLRCAACGRTSVTYNLYNHLQLELAGNDLKNIEDLLAMYQDVAPLDGDVPCSIPSCGRFGTQNKEERIHSWPQVLVLHLKRWDFDRSTQSATKVNREISYETVLPISQNYMYHLVGVVVHAGQAGGGHYTAYVRSPANMWFYYDDAHAPRPCTNNDALGAKRLAYLLSYQL